MERLKWLEVEPSSSLIRKIKDAEQFLVKQYGLVSDDELRSWVRLDSNREYSCSIQVKSNGKSYFVSKSNSNAAFSIYQARKAMELLLVEHNLISHLESKQWKVA